MFQFFQAPANVSGNRGRLLADFDDRGLRQRAGLQQGENAILARGERQYIIANLDLDRSVREDGLADRPRGGVLLRGYENPPALAIDLAIVYQQGDPVVDDGELQARDFLLRFSTFWPERERACAALIDSSLDR